MHNTRGDYFHTSHRRSNDKFVLIISFPLFYCFCSHLNLIFPKILVVKLDDLIIVLAEVIRGDIEKCSPWF